MTREKALILIVACLVGLAFGRHLDLSPKLAQAPSMAKADLMGFIKSVRLRDQDEAPSGKKP